MSEKKESITDKKISRRSMLKWTGALAAAVAVGVGAGYGASELLRPVVPSEVITQTEKVTYTQLEEKKYLVTTTGGAQFVYVTNGRIVRTEPFRVSPEEAAKASWPWSFKVGERVYQAPLKYQTSTWGNAGRAVVYAASRGKYPLKRVDWDPNGDRHPENRGKSDYVRISWDEAFSIVGNEIKRIDQKYGRSAVFTPPSFHVEWGTVNCGALAGQFWNVTGGCTARTNIPNSWEGWTYGASFMYGFHWGNGTANETDLLIDTMQNSKQILLWGTDPLTVGQTYGGNSNAVMWPWFKEQRKKVISVNPVLPYTGFFADQWIPIIPGTDAALAAAIANVWVTEGTYDKQYVDTHTIGFDEKTLPEGAPANGSFKSYIMGELDGVAKTPEWAEKITGVKAADIRDLARGWASNATSLLVYYSGACRMAYDYEWARMMVALQAMQGLGKPGVNIWSCRKGTPIDQKREPGLIGYGDGGIVNAYQKKYANPIKQVITEGYVDKAILDPPAAWTGGSSIGAGVSLAFAEHVYPMPGYSEIKMIYQHGASNMHQDADINHWIRVYQSPKIETVVVQAPWFESDCTYADVYLPANTPYERNDISEPGKVGAYSDTITFAGRVSVYSQKAIENVGESKSDLEIYTGLAERLGFKDAFTEGNTEEDWLKKLFVLGKLPVSYEELKSKGYYLHPHPSDYMQAVYNPQLTWFYNMPAGSDFVKNGLKTPTGKIEFFSTTLFNQYGFEDLRAGIAATPKYRESWEGRNTHPLVDKYPLQLLTPHPRHRYHGKYNDITWFRDLPFSKIKGQDGREYEPILINPVDAQARGLKDDDVVRVFNDRGQILCAVKQTGRIVPGAVSVCYGSWPDLAERGKAGSLDKAGNSNMLTPLRPPSGIQEHSCDQPWNTALVQVEGWRA